MNIQQKLRYFINNDKEYPLLAGFCLGFYVLCFYYSNNFDLAHSHQQLMFFTGYYILFPTVCIYLAYQITRRTRFKSFSRRVIFVLTLSLLAFFILQNLNLLHYKRIFVACFIAFVLLSFKVSNYKFVLLLVIFMTFFPLYKLGEIIIGRVGYNSWNVQPDGILACKFKSDPNVYYIQVDGYANAETLKDKLYRFDNSGFDNWLKTNGFTCYGNFRSNYNSTIQSNASAFNMMHHYGKDNRLFKTATDYIMDDNPALKIFENNGYRSFFITERPYLMMNRPEMKFDYSNFSFSEMPYLKDGWSSYKEITDELKTRILKNRDSKNFFFIEKFDPGHISVLKSGSMGRVQERVAYLERLQVANAWLKDIVGFIEKNDPDALIIIGADHGGFVGFDYTAQSLKRITDKDLLNSVFGAKLAIKWNNPNHINYDGRLKTSVNLFRTVFSFLSEDKSYLGHLQPDVSYHNYDKNDLRKIYSAIR